MKPTMREDLKYAMRERLSRWHYNGAPGVYEMARELTELAESFLPPASIPIVVTPELDICYGNNSITFRVKGEAVTFNGPSGHQYVRPGETYTLSTGFTINPL